MIDAGRARFELAEACTSTVFKTVSLDRSDTYPLCVDITANTQDVNISQRKEVVESGFPLGRLNDFLATHVGTHGLRNDDGAVLLLVVLENGDQPASGGQRTVQRGNGAGAAIFHTFANVQATGLELLERPRAGIGAGRPWRHALRRDLAQTSEKVRRDNLTGTLNRSGLEEIWLRETGIARTNATPLSIGILDIDNFKLINDQYGHVVGDEALVHLTAVIRNALHGTDTMARYGGEEFVILLPDTPLDQGIEAMVRLQRDLTKKFFLDGAEKLLITFSAGVAQLSPDEDSESAIKRADKAMYAAKRAGKNRVLGA